MVEHPRRVQHERRHAGRLLEELEDSASDTASEAAESEEEMDTVDAPIVSGLRMMGLMEKMALPNEKPTPKNKWGLVIAPRLSSMVHSRQNIMEKAAAYKMKKNLEVPTTFKSKSFTSESTSILEAYASAVDIKIGDYEKEKNQIINDIIRDETEKCLLFASQNPKISLPDNLDTGFNADNGVFTPKRHSQHQHTRGHCW